MSMWSTDEVSACRDSWRRSSCSVWRPLGVTARRCKQINEWHWMDELNLSCCNQTLFHQRRVTTRLILLNHWIILILDVCECLFVQPPTIFGRAHLPAPSQVWFCPWVDDSGQEHVFSGLHVIHCAEMLSADTHLTFWLIFVHLQTGCVVLFGLWNQWPLRRAWHNMQTVAHQPACPVPLSQVGYCVRFSSQLSILKPLRSQAVTEITRIDSSAKKICAERK